MEYGALWVGIVAPTVAVVVSAYLVVRAVRDERRFARRSGGRREGTDGGPEVWERSLRPAGPAIGGTDSDDRWSESESWKRDGDGWTPGGEPWRPEETLWEPGEGERPW